MCLPIHMRANINIHIHTYIHTYRWGVEKDISKAVEHFEKAMEQGDAGGYVGLGYLHYYGMGHVPQNYSRALELYRQV